MNRQKDPMRMTLTIIFIILVFIILTITMAIMGFVSFLLIQAGILSDIALPNVAVPFIMIAIVSIIVGTMVAAIISSIPLKPLHKLINGMNQLANGNYDMHIHLGNHKIGKDLEDSFNKLATELQNTEMLRSDFINNFSHEFKTPIVSIRGFAKLLQKGNLNIEKQHEYLTIIANESSRLADMATNVLDLTKVENQNILTDITVFNLSEQIRGCILLLEKKWSKKNIEMNTDFNEYEIEANYELLKQVWINLIDNAIKFSDMNGEIGIIIRKMSACLQVTIKNRGEEICKQDQYRIFQKFYQGDTSHYSQGNGIGLAIVKKITELHGGDVSVTSSLGETAFCVVLPSIHQH